MNKSAEGITIMRSEAVRVQSTNIYWSRVFPLIVKQSVGVVVLDVHIVDPSFAFGISILHSIIVTVMKTVIACSKSNYSEVDEAIVGGADFNNYCLPWIGIMIQNATNISIARTTIKHTIYAGISINSSHATTLCNVELTSIVGREGILVNMSSDIK